MDRGNWFTGLVCSPMIGWEFDKLINSTRLLSVARACLAENYKCWRTQTRLNSFYRWAVSHLRPAEHTLGALINGLNGGGTAGKPCKHQDGECLHKSLEMLSFRGDWLLINSLHGVAVLSLLTKSIWYIFWIFLYFFWIILEDSSIEQNQSRPSVFVLI